MDILELHGIVLKSADHAEFDRRLTILTAERGKITAFSRAVKRPGNRMMAATEPFAFGSFFFTEGRSAYNLKDVEIDNYFEGLRLDLDAFYLGSYFLEFADYYSRENIEDRPLLSLIYTSLLALIRDDFDNGFVRSVFEIKIISIEGELPDIADDSRFLPGTLHALKHIISSTPNNLYTFKVSDEVKRELFSISGNIVNRYVKHDFSSLKIMRELTG